MYYIDFYHLKDSPILEKIKDIDTESSEMKVNYIPMGEKLKAPKKKNEIIFFEENDSFLSCIQEYDRVRNAYDGQPIIIILSNNKEIFNVVRWMRNGAADYLWMGEISAKILANSLRGASDYIYGRRYSDQKEMITDDFSKERILVPTSVNWDKLANDCHYDLALIMINVLTTKGAVGRYSDKSQFQIYDRIKMEADLEARKFGGRLWFWQNNFGVLVFHFGDFINCSVLSGISFYQNFFLTCIEKLNLDEIMNLKIAIHQGNGIYHKTNTEQITSDLINSLAHIIHQFVEPENLVVTQQVYEHLSFRLKPLFSKLDSFETNDIYQFNKEILC
ncbi:MAG: hypothetical protein MJB14_15700 [Spirochaetes bacterium]|nr:hypothetical protein [Spirochaetota bacterium]